MVTNILLIILSVCVVARFVQQFYLDIKSTHQKRQYDLVCEQLRDSERYRQEEAKTYRKIISDRDDIIKRLQESQLMTFKYRQTPEGIVVEQEQEKENERDGVEEVDESEIPAMD